MLFDEATPEQAQRQNELFQAPACWLGLGASTTNCHTYKVMMSGVKMMICSNVWAEHLATVASVADLERIGASSVDSLVAAPIY